MTGAPPAGGRAADVEQTLMAAIGCGDLEPGAVHSSASIARRYTAPVPWVRAALTALAQDRLVEPVDGAGFRPAEPSVAELGELIELRRLIEVSAARRVTERGVSDEEGRRLAVLAGATVDAARAGDVIGYIKTDLAFHLLLVGLEGDARLVELVRLLRTRCRIDKLVAPLEGCATRNAEEHLRLVHLCVAGDTAAVGELLSEHISRPLTEHRDVHPEHLTAAGRARAPGGGARGLEWP